MKLLRFGPEGAERPGLLDRRGNIRDLGGVIDDNANPIASLKTLELLSGLAIEDLPIASPARLGPCVAGIGKVVCIGLNYEDHALETKMEPPTEPVLFLKATSSVCGPDDDIVLPPGSRRTDWEIELGVVIGASGVHIPKDRAMDHVAGYCIVNDISERAYQLKHGGQWTKGKSYDHFCPVGPWLVTKDEIPDPQRLGLRLEYNGAVMQDSSTEKMIVPIADLVSYVSQFMTLHPGDIIATGTPAGVGMARNPRQFLEPGGEIRASIEGLGSQTQRIVASQGLSE